MQWPPLWFLWWSFWVSEYDGLLGNFECKNLSWNLYMKWLFWKSKYEWTSRQFEYEWPFWRYEYDAPLIDLNMKFHFQVLIFIALLDVWIWLSFLQFKHALTLSTVWICNDPLGNFNLNGPLDTLSMKSLLGGLNMMTLSAIKLCNGPLGILNRMDLLEIWIRLTLLAMKIWNGLLRILYMQRLWLWTWSFINM